MSFDEPLSREGSAERERALIELIADHANDAFVVTEAEPIDEAAGGPRILYVNPAFERLTGWSREEVIGRTPRILQSPDTDRRELDRIRIALESWQKVRATLLNVRKDGTPFWIELDIVPVADETGWYHYWVAIQRDVSERMAYQQALEDARRAAEEASAAKSRFLASIGQALRTPVDAVLGYSDVLRSQTRGPLNTRQMEVVSHIGDSGAHLLNVLGDLLDHARSETGRMNLMPEPVDVVPLLRAVAALTAPQANERRVRLEVSVAEEPFCVFCDPVRLKQAAVNIVSNAVAAAPAGGSVALQAARRDGMVVITVADDGPGLSPQEIDLVQLPFVRLGDPAGARGEGLGLGLPIALHIMRLHGGDLVIRSDRGAGTTVDLLLPAEAP